MTCPLCGTQYSALCHGAHDPGQDHPDVITPIEGPSPAHLLHCGVCDLVFRHVHDRPMPSEERAHYLTHENTPESAGYVRFLRRALDPALPYLEPGMQGVDWGSGPGPTLSGLVRSAGYACHDYDPVFDPHTLSPPYDFIFATECIEHMHLPGRDLAHLVSCLSPGGLFIAMTECWESPLRFPAWRYARDPTHTSFFHRRTFTWLATHFSLKEVWSDGSRVFILRRRSGSTPPRSRPAAGTP